MKRAHLERTAVRLFMLARRYRIPKKDKAETRREMEIKIARYTEWFLCDMIERLLTEMETIV